MQALILNPGRKKRKGKKRRLSRKGLAAIRRAARRRARHRRASRTGVAARKAVTSLLCGPMGRIRRLRRRSCPGRAPKSRGILGGIAGMIASRTGPSIISHNPGGAGVASKVTAGFSPKVIFGVAPIAVGVLGNRWLTAQIQKRYPNLSTGWKAPVVGIATAGALSAVSAIASKRYAAPVLVGALAQTLVTAVVSFRKPAVVAMPVAPVSTVKGLGYSYTPDYDEAMPGGLMGLGHDGALGLDEMSDDISDVDVD